MEARPLDPQFHQDNNSALLTTGGLNDPLLPKLIDAINRAQEIEITVAFIRVSGLKLLFGALSDAVNRGATIKILTSDYLDVTDPQSLRELMLLKERDADIRIYQCDGQQSFHMKSYIFIHTHDGDFIEGCAYVGSSNISKAALTTGHEWNLRLQCKGSTDDLYVQQFAHIRRQFREIFSHSLVKPLSHEWIDSYLKRRRKMRLVAVEAEELIEAPTPSDIQTEALQALQQSRLDGYRRGLVVLATGLGKTWLAAFDTQQCKAEKVLFVAHREEILMQAQQTFVRIRPDARTGFYNGKVRNKEVDMLFASVQTLGRAEHLQQFSKDHFDYIVVDEFHHADAKTYRNLLKHFEPEFLLGLTATPERTDQADILSLCDNNLVFERNLVSGINARLLAPFHYFGVDDKYVDYDEIPWRNGKFDINALENAFASRKRAGHILTHWQEKKQLRTLGFCISKRHADFMATVFAKAGFRAAAVYSNSELRRHEALNQLETGELDVLFSVDLFNEGTDLPAIDTVLMLRPTESKILFLQQLGRGLRLHKDKQHLVVIDFIGNHKSFLTKPVALHNSHSVRQVTEQIKQQATALPDGCFANYDPKVIDFLERMARKQKASMVEEYQSLKSLLGYRPTATEFYHYLAETGTDFNKVRSQKGSWFALLDHEQELSKAESGVAHTHHQFLLEGIEKASMTRCFKMVLLDAFLELDGFIHPPTTEVLATRSWHLLKRRPALYSSELPAKQQAMAAEDKGWHSYWKGNPVKAFAEGENTFFEVRKGQFTFKADVRPEHRDILHQQVQELVELRLEQYCVRKKLRPR
ncbi:DEAD/DEAH box helicase family protein [Endozoicomonas lisbonensis]|uniref:Superfamily II DNA or RNA helicase/HKD family nuclease n=1 Tax=Endozoicomonas lisbonensis TaxID=3120522 RepID=A0ABV2SQ28_9GAMM